MQDPNGAEGLPQAPEGMPDGFSDVPPDASNAEGAQAETPPEQPSGGTEGGTRTWASGRFESPEALEKAYQEMESKMTQDSQDNASLREELQAIREELQTNRQPPQQQGMPPIDLEAAYAENPVQAIQLGALQAVLPVLQRVTQMERKQAVQQYKDYLPDQATIEKKATEMANKYPGIMDPNAYYAMAAGELLPKIVAQARSQGAQEAKSTYQRAQTTQQSAPDTGASYSQKPSDLPPNIEEIIAMNQRVFPHLTREQIIDDVKKWGP